MGPLGKNWSKDSITVPLQSALPAPGTISRRVAGQSVRHILPSLLINQAGLEVRITPSGERVESNDSFGVPSAAGEFLRVRLPSPACQLLESGLYPTLALLIALTSGCFDNSEKIASAVLETKSSGESVVEATQGALKMIGYQVGESIEKQDVSEGSRTINGERLGMVTAIGPAKVHIKIVVRPLEKGTEITVDVIPPRGAYGSTTLPLHDYQYALSQLIPDLSLKSKKVPKEFF